MTGICTSLIKEKRKSERDKRLSGKFQRQFKSTCRCYGKYDHREVVCKSHLHDEEISITREISIQVLKNIGMIQVFKFKKENSLIEAKLGTEKWMEEWNCKWV